MKFQHDYSGGYGKYHSNTYYLNSPDVTWQGAAPGPYDATADAAANAQLKALNDPKCRPN